MPFEYEAISEFKDGYAIVAKKHVEVDDNTTIAEELQQSLSNDSNDDEFYIYYLGDRDEADMKFGIINSQGSIVLPVEYDNVSRVSEGMFGVKKKDKWGFTNLQGDLVIPYMFDRILPPFSHGTIQVDDCFDDEANTISGGVLKSMLASDVAIIDVKEHHIKHFEVIIELLRETTGFSNRSS